MSALGKSLATGMVLAAFALPAAADIAVVSTDNHTVLVNGSQKPAEHAPPDRVMVIDLGQYPPGIVATVDAPGSVVGPPMAVAVAADESWAIVTSATRIDPADASKIVPNDEVSVIDLKSSPPQVMQQLHAGAGATVVAIAPGGKLALVANRTEGTVSIFGVDGKRLEPLGKLDLGNPKAGPSGIAFLPDGKSALLSRDGDSMISVLRIDGTNVTIDPRPLTAGYRPYTLDVARDGKLAAVSNMGRGDGDVDTVSLIDLSVTPFRTIETVSVAGSPEGLKFSPDGTLLAVGAQDGSTKPAESPFYNDHGKFVLLAVDGKHLRKLAEAPVGRWSQGIAFARDGRTILVENMVEKTISVFRWEHDKLTGGEPLALGGAPAAIRTAWP